MRWMNPVAWRQPNTLVISVELFGKLMIWEDVRILYKDRKFKKNWLVKKCSIVRWWLSLLTDVVLFNFYWRGAKWCFKVIRIGVQESENFRLIKLDIIFYFISSSFPQFFFLKFYNFFTYINMFLRGAILFWK